MVMELMLNGGLIAMVELLKCCHSNCMGLLSTHYTCTEPLAWANR
ncbi:hypothetical protein [Microcoleus phage My-WqHQDG]|nr:hypothetical protein [Microcoleus phage My-WqHQDG]